MRLRERHIRKWQACCRWLAPAAACLLLMPALGCRKQADGLTQVQRQSGDRLSQIAKRTNGDWNKLTPEERAFLVRDLSYGNEQSARMLLLAAAGKIGGRPGGPPRR
jgi:hypothetical protein